MGVAIDTIAGKLAAGTAATALSALTAATGDSYTVRNFNAPAWAKLELATLKAGTSGIELRIKSPMLHDNVTGLTFWTAESPSVHLLPREVGTPLISGDVLTVQSTAAANVDAVAALHVYYSDLPGAAQRLHSWGELSGLVKSIKAVEVDVTNSGTTGTWTDTAINATEDQLHAHTDYALLGYGTTVAVTAIGLKGQATSNLRVCGPGQTASLDTSEYFIAMEQQHQTPHIPVFNADNRGATYVSTIDNTASTTPKVTLIVAELTQLVTP